MPPVARVFLALFLLALTVPAAAAGNTLHVTKKTDNVPGSLRQTIAAANPNDTVDVPAGTYKLTAGEIAINENLTIQGAGATKTIVDAQGASRVFNLMGGTYTLRGLTVTGGNNPTGGGILSTAAGLALDGVTVRGNRAGGGSAPGTPGAGAGIYSDSEDLTLKASSVVGNHAGGGGPSGFGSGGGIAVRASVTGPMRSLSLEHSVVSGNAAGGTGAGGNGAGIDASDSGQDGGTWSVSLTDSTVARNAAGGGGNGGSASGAGINGEFGNNKNNKVTLTVARSTINGNNAGGLKASGYGGGIGFGAGDPTNTLTLTLTNTTISDNFVGGGSPYGGGVGGGIDYGPPTALGSSATLDHVTVAGNTAASGTTIQSHGGGIGGTAGVGLRNTIIAGNNAGVGRNCQNPAAFSTHSLEDADTCGLSGDSQRNTNPKLLPLGDYGGPTLTRKLALDSPAINHASRGFCPSTDQRGVIRDKNHCDVGAFELTHSDLAVKGSASRAKVGVGRKVTFSYKVTNNGPQDALAVKLTAAIPKKLRFIGASGGTCSGRGTLTCALGTVPAGGSHTLKIVATPLHAGKISLRGTVASGSGDANPGNNSASASILALPAVQKLAVKPASWRLGNGTSIRYTLSDAAKVRLAFALCTKLKKNHKTCAHYSNVGSLDRHGHAGKNKFHFKGQVPGVGQLPLGRYRLSASAIDSKGNRSPARNALFRLRP